MSSSRNSSEGPDRSDGRTQLTDRVVIPRDQHPVSRRDISPGCLKVLYRLNEAGHTAYIVGGGVRDLLLDLQPKDFDVATDATPEEIHRLFRNSRIIGRRFQIVHIRFGPEIIEVSTFRGTHDDTVEIPGESLSRRVRDIDSARSTSGMLLRDNVWGSIEEDVLRRDFTVNALYYTVDGFEIHDFVNGLADIESRTLRMIGDPEQRYREDPVRTLRAIRLAVKLGFNIEPATATPIPEYGKLLESVPAARLFDECLKLFFAGCAEETCAALRAHGLFDTLFPAAAAVLADDPSGEYARFIDLALANTDARIREGKSVTPYFLLAALLWPAVERTCQELTAGGMPEQLAMTEAGTQTVMSQIQRISIPKRFSIPMREIWEGQLRLLKRGGRRAELFLQQKRFRATYDFLLLREAAGRDMEGLGDWWTSFQNADPQQRAQMQQALGKTRKRSKPRRRKAKSRSDSPADP